MRYTGPKRRTDRPIREGEDIDPMGDRFKPQFHLLLHSARLVETELRRALEPLGIGPRQARILVLIHVRGPLSQAEAARIVGVTPASMSTMTDRLLAAGLVSRGGTPRVLRLTEAGTAALDEIDAAWSEVDAHIAAALGAEDAGHLRRLTLRLRDALGGVGLHGPRPER